MNVDEFAKQILFGTGLEDKLLGTEHITSYHAFSLKSIPGHPGRDAQIMFSEEQLKFPKASQFAHPDKRAQALHFFANHELLAIELMAAALLSFPADSQVSERIHRGIIQTIKDEQKHLQLYLHRMKQLGITFGDLPLNQFFWNLFLKIDSYEQFFALMALTLEAANLDFCCYYGDIFSTHGDSATANIMKVVYEDEIGHVALGAHWLERWRGNQTLWDYYVSLLPEKVTPARGKGKTFDHRARLQAGLDSDFVEKSKNYEDDFRVTARKEWK